MLPQKEEKPHYAHTDVMSDFGSEQFRTSMSTVSNIERDSPVVLRKKKTKGFPRRKKVRMESDVIGNCSERSRDL